ncbi:MAG: anhydro-N-acetylmuramic acid kinase, partial [bacterium]
MIVLGVMSGTSLDGLDLALCHFTEEYNNMQHELLQSATLPYNAEWIKRLSRAHQLTGRELVILNHEYGQFIGAAINNFIREGKIKPSLIASHGHTIFHEPDSGFTFQAGLGANIAAVTGLPCVSDFRILDVALGGQGAPLVPAGEIALYPGYDAYINLGGFANITIKTEDKVLAFDISPCNYALNHAARKMNHSCDEGGEIARKGNISTQLLDALNNLEFYNQEPPKSLGREWFERNFKVLLETGTTNNTDLLRTLCEH